MSMTKKLAKAFETGSTLTATEITKKFGLKNPNEAVRQLRMQGYCIYTNSNGYRLGKPSKRMIAIANAVAGSSIFTQRG